MVSGRPTVAAAGVAAAELLVEACGPGEDLHAGVVRGLAGDLGRGLSSLAAAPTPGPPVDAALLCADLATLAACNAAALPGREGAIAAAHLAAGTARALAALAEAAAGPPDGTPDGTPGNASAENVLRDARSAGWKADLAVRQLVGEPG